MWKYVKDVKYVDIILYGYYITWILYYMDVILCGYYIIWMLCEYYVAIVWILCGYYVKICSFYVDPCAYCNYVHNTYIFIYIEWHSNSDYSKLRNRRLWDGKRIHEYITTSKSERTILRNSVIETVKMKQCSWNNIAGTV